MTDAIATLRARLAASIEAKQSMFSDVKALATFHAIVDLVITTYKSAGRLYIAGNVTSTIQELHIVFSHSRCECVENAMFPLPAA